ncbi:MAG TPA: AraC family transcriptional regulator [Lacunisphaera sp.]|nr:AraC family transcriptional regulator [Lacunisphaera sp.]
MPPEPKHASPEPAVRWREWINLRTNLAWIYEGGVMPDFQRGNFSPDHMGAWLIKRGSALLRQENKTVRATAGDWLVPWPGFRYQEFSSDAEILSVRFRAVWPDNKPLFDRGLSVKFPAQDFPRLERLAREILRSAGAIIPNEPIQLAQESVPFERYIMVNMMFMRWLAQLYTALCSLGLKPARVGVHDERIIAALQRLDSFALSERLSEGRLARESGLGESQFVRLFRQEMGETPKQYFDQRRRNYCREMLTGSDVPIKEVAFSLGFKRLSDFSAWFKNHFALSPRSFRNQVLHSPHF